MIKLLNVTKQYNNASVLKHVTLNIDETGIYCVLGRKWYGCCFYTASCISAAHNDFSTQTVIYVVLLVRVANRWRIGGNSLYFYTYCIP